MKLIPKSPRNSNRVRSRNFAPESLEDRRVLAALLQVVHNSPYEAASLVDVYANDALLLDDFAFRDASPFVEVPSDTDVKIDITAADAADNSSPVFSTTARFEDKTYVAMAVGDPLGSDSQPAFTLAVTDIAQTSAVNQDNVEFLVFHGAPDAPGVDIAARGAGTLVNDITFSQFSDSYISVPAASYLVDISPEADGSPAIASYEADLSGAAGQAIVVAASGFLSPEDASAPAFGLLAVFADGTTALLPTTDLPPARVQVIHNSPYAAASVVDVYANDALLLDDFAFRAASPFVDVPSGVDVKLDITGADAADNSSPVFSATVNLDQSTYIVAAVGDPLAGENQPAFSLAITDAGREAAADSGQVDVMVLHGSPDAPTVDVRGRGIGTLIDNLSYPNFTGGYLSVAPGTYTLDIAPADDTSLPVASFEADLTGAAGSSLVVAASGFLSPGQDDPAFGLLAVFQDGTTALLPGVPTPPVPGDSNGDGRFDHRDLTRVFQAGKFETGQDATFEEGDWNNDGKFDTSDIVYVFELGNYVVDDEAAAPLNAAAVDWLFETDSRRQDNQSSN